MTTFHLLGMSAKTAPLEFWCGVCLLALIVAIVIAWSSHQAGMEGAGE